LLIRAPDEDVSDEEIGLTSLIPQNQETELQPTAAHRSELWGLTLMASSAFAFSFMSLLVKLGNNNHLPSFELVLARSLIQWLFAMALHRYRAPSISMWGPPRLRPWLHVRGISGALGLALFYFSLSVLPLSDATVVFFTGPPFTAILARLLLNEPLTRWHLLSMILCLMGVVLVARPAFIFGFDESSSMYSGWGIVAALVGAMFSALAYVTVRKITAMATDGELDVTVFVIYFGAWSTLIAIIGLWGFQEPKWPESVELWLLLFGVGFAAFLGQLMLNRGLQLAPAGPGTMMRNLDVVFAFVFDITLLHHVPAWTSFVGASLIVSVALFNGLAKWRKLSQK
jgi:drug/metabolite transporter (DMT)-like permease